MNANKTEIIDKPEQKILEELKVKHNELKNAQKKISLHNALASKDDNPLKLALE